MDVDFAKSKSHKTLWNMIAVKLREQGGIEVSGEKCANKWKSIKRDYRNCIDYNKVKMDIFRIKVTIKRSQGILGVIAYISADNLAFFSFYVIAFHF